MLPSSHRRKKNELEHNDVMTLSDIERYYKKPNATIDVRNIRDVRDSREYAKLDERINKIQTYIESIKQTQDKILELLQAK